MVGQTNRMTSPQLRAALRNGDPVYGTLIVSDSPRWPAQIAQIGLDFVFIDTEHVALDRQSLAWMCQAYASLGLPPLVRIPSPDPHAATMALDAGAAGIVAPYIETVEQVRSLHGAVKLRPIKGARLEAMLGGRAGFEPELVAYQHAQHGENLLLINVESRPAMENLDALLAVEGVDAVLIGPHDLSCSLGLPERYEAPAFEAAVREIVRRSRARGVGAGIHSWMGVAREIAWAHAGMNLFIHSADIIAMRQTLTAEVRELRAALGDRGGANRSEARSGQLVDFQQAKP
jgi:4-hydroxy-2-oxoheptanedioate aldolase